MAGGSKAPSFPSNYVTVAHLQERWLKERGQKKKKEQEDLEGESSVEVESGGSRARVEGANKVPSFPSNYVTVAHLQERWLKERDQKKKKEQEDLGRERKRLDDQAAAEIKRKKEVEELEREQKRAEDQDAAEILRKKEEGDRERPDDWTVADVQRRSNCIFKAPDVGAVAGEEERKKNKKNKKNKNKQKGTYGYVEGDVRAEKYGLTQIDEDEPKFWSFSVPGYYEAGPSRGNREAGSEVNDLNHKVGVEIGVSSVNRWVRKGGDGKAEERHGFRVEAAGADMDPEPRALLASGGPRKNGKMGDRWAKGKQETRQFLHESKPEDELDPTVSSGPKCEVLPANGGPRKNGNMGNRWVKMNQETRRFGHESKPDDELDPTVISGPNCGISPVNGGPTKNGKMADRQAKGKQKRRQFGHGSKPDDELDPAVINDPKCKVWPENIGPRKNGKMVDNRGKGKQETRQYDHESKPEDELDLKVVSEPNCGGFPGNRGPRKNGKMVDRRTQGKLEMRQFGHESKPEDELDLTVVKEPNCGVLPANGGPSKNRKVSDRLAKGKQETRQFGHENKPEDELDLTGVSEPNCGVLPADGGPSKNGKMGDRPVKGKQETRQFGPQSKPEDELDRMVVSKPKCGVLTVNGGARRSSGKKEASQGAGAEKMVESNGSDGKSDIRLELGTLSLHEGLSEMPKMSRERRQVGREIKPESNNTGKSERAEVLSGRRRGRIDNRGSQRNGVKEVSREAIVEKRVESYKEENQKADIEPELKALSLNGERKKGKKSSKKMKKRTEWKPESHELGQLAETKQEGGVSQGTRAEMILIKNLEREQTKDEARPKSNELLLADSAQKVEILSFDVGVKRNGKEDVSRGTRDETIAEIIKKEEQRDVGPELRTLSVNYGVVKNGERVYKWAEKDPEAGQTSGEAEAGVSSINSGFMRHGTREYQGEFWRTRDTRTCRISQNNRSGRVDGKDGGMAWVKKE